MNTSPQTSASTTVRDAISRNVAFDMLARVGYLFSRFFIPPFVLARVSLEAYGLWSTAFILVAYIGISTMGVANVNIKFVAEFSARGEYKRANELLSTGLVLMLPGFAVLYAALWFGWPQLVPLLKISPALQGDAKEVVLMVVAIFLVSLSLGCFGNALTGAQLGNYNQVSWVTGYTVETALIFLFVGMGRGIRGLAEAFLIRTLVEESVGAFFAFRKLHWLRLSPRMFNRGSLRLLFSFGGVVQIASLLSIVLSSIERAVAAPLAGLAATGLLDIGKKLPNMASSIPGAFANAFLPAASYLQGGLEGSEEQKETIHKLYVKGSRYSNLVTAYFCGFTALLALPLLDVWLGRRFEGAALLMVFFSVSTQIHLMTGSGTSMLKGLGRPAEEFYYCIPNVLALALTLPAARLITGRWTALSIGGGVAVATVLSATFFVLRANRLMGVHLGEFLRRVVWPGIMPYLLAAPLALLFRAVPWGTGRWVLAGYVVSAGIGYSLVFLAATYWIILDQGERWWFVAIARQRLGRLTEHTA